MLSRGLEKSAQKKELKLEEFTNNTEEVEKFTASNLDDAIELLSLATESTGKTVDLLDRHPERRVKSAYAVFEEREMAILKEENPSLRMTQLKQLLQKKWKKSPENPMVSVFLKLSRPYLFLIIPVLFHRINNLSLIIPPEKMKWLHCK